MIVLAAADLNGQYCLLLNLRKPAVTVASWQQVQGRQTHSALTRRSRYWFHQRDVSGYWLRAIGSDGCIQRISTNGRSVQIRHEPSHPWPSGIQIIQDWSLWVVRREVQ